VIFREVKVKVSPLYIMQVERGRGMPPLILNFCAKRGRGVNVKPQLIYSRENPGGFLGPGAGLDGAA
jgi:hypothetical protein